MRVLLVDDDQEVQGVVREYLEALYITDSIVTASAVSEAKRVLKSKTIDLIVSDVHMPRQSGMELFKHVLSSMPQLPFVFFTGGAVSVGREFGRICRPRVDALVAKPNFDELENVLIDIAEYQNANFSI